MKVPLGNLALSGAFDAVDVACMVPLAEITPVATAW